MIHWIDDGPEVYDNYWANEQKCRRITDLLIKYISFNQSTFVVALIYAFYNISIGNMNTSTWFLPFSMDPPFNTESFTGWFILWFFQQNMSLAYITCMVTITSYFVCCCFYIETMCNHFDLLMRLKREKSNTKRRESKENGPRFKEKLHEAVKLHINIFE